MDHGDGESGGAVRIFVGAAHVGVDEQAQVRVVDLDDVDTDALDELDFPAQRFDAGLHDRLTAWANSHYRDRLRPADLADPQLLVESRRALDELTGILDLGSGFYPFQR